MQRVILTTGFLYAELMLDAKAYLFFLNIDWHVVKMLDNLQRYWSRVDLHAFEVLFFFFSIIGV